MDDPDDELTEEDGPYFTSACPCCGAVEPRLPYDIGSGPELSCAKCEWCWGAEGQPLQPLPLPPNPWLGDASPG